MGLIKIERLTICIDGHNDFAIWIRAYYQNHIYQQNFSRETSLYGQVDFPRLRRGGLRGQFWSVYVGCPDQPNNYSDEAYFGALRDTLQQIDLMQRVVNAHSDQLVFANSAADVWRVFGESSHISSFLGVEGLHQIANSVSVLRLYHRLGVRYVTLTHDCHNAYADSATPTLPLHNGLSDAGKTIVGEMNRLGMAVDLAHVSHETMRDVLAISTAPVIFSHSSAYALCPHMRNVPDDVLHMLRENRGIIMITFYPEYSRCDDPAAANLSDVADHIQYVGELIGYRYVGLGSDFDGMPAGPQGLEDVSKYPDLIAELLHRGVGIDDLAGVIGGNILRVMEGIERVAAENWDELPLEDNVKPFFGVF
ncbi:hypothetical protein Trco_001668 [Trichoderma cornu-damae]|uniref:Dipeptidase n=1 Tax=Trichoderma cornu-damae TaxID=654480 RepID=A0A9P8QTM7_9HYPO|nr:hypothetical protein Trco_001668 [Trichoderma cornu-damae]